MPVTFSCSSFLCQDPSSSQPAPLLINLFSILLTLCVIGITFMSLGWDYWSTGNLPVATPWEKSPPLATADKALAEGGTSLSSLFPPVMPCWWVSSVAVSPRVQQTVSHPWDTVPSSVSCILPTRLFCSLS